MKKSIIIIVVIIVAAVVVFLLKKNNVMAPTETGTEVTPETSTPVAETETSPEAPSSPTPTYSYTNDEFNFAVVWPGLVATAKGSTDPVYKPFIFTFGPGDQSSLPEDKRVQNSMAVYVWKNPAEFQILMSQKSPLDTEIVNGHEFSVYVVSEGPRTMYRYATNQDGITYDVGVWNRSDAKRFYFID